MVKRRTIGIHIEKINFVFIYDFIYAQHECTARQLSFKYIRALVVRCASGIEALTDNFGWDPGFWLHDGGVTHECRSRGQVDCEVRRHSRWAGNVMGVVQYHLELPNVLILARNQFNDFRAWGTCECSTR
jgi:hypothetical protein